jgi:hypothetical protein
MEKRDPAVRFDLVARLWMVPVDHGTPCLVDSGLWCRITLLIDVLLEVADTSFTVVFFFVKTKPLPYSVGLYGWRRNDSS